MIATYIEPKSLEILKIQAERLPEEYTGRIIELSINTNTGEIIGEQMRVVSHNQLSRSRGRIRYPYKFAGYLIKRKEAEDIQRIVDSDYNLL